MLEHLIDINFEPEICDDEDVVTAQKAAPTDTASGKANTIAWLEANGSVIDTTAADTVDQEQARIAFGALTTGADDPASREQIVALKTPAAVRHLTGMLTAYDWEFVEQAKELRGYVVAKLVEETQNPSANIRLKALGLLGKVTEVSLFTEKIEVKQDRLDDHELEDRIKQKLNKYMGVADVVDVAQKPHEADDAI